MESREILTKTKLKEDQTFKISKFKEVIKKTSPHKHGGYYELIFLSAGEGFHWMEAENYPVKTPDLYFIKPDQLHCWQFTAIPKGYVLLFKDEFLDPISEAPLIRLIHQLNTINRIHLKGCFDPEPIFEAIFEEYKKDSEFSQDIVLGFLRTLFAMVLKSSNKQESIIKEYSTLYDRFLGKLATKCPQMHKVQDYADLLNTSAQNLNSVCKKQSKLSVGQHISQQLLLEAKRNILHTDKSVNELADYLHFNDASYFIKFFKKHTGKTPTQFRNKYFGHSEGRSNPY